MISSMPADKKMPKRTNHLSTVIQRNIDTLLEVRKQLEQKKSTQNRIADAITAFTGSLYFVYFHVLWFGFWLLANTGMLGIPAFDPYPFGLLTMIVSLEAIFLSTFVLISQNRMAVVNDDRADLDLQIDLLAEYEITKILCLADAISDHLGLKEGRDPELQDLKFIVPPEEVLKEMDKRKREMGI